MLDVFEDGERLLPCLPRLREITGGITGVTEVGEGVRSNPAVTEFPGDAERAPIAGGGFAKARSRSSRRAARSSIPARPPS
jgi:hypothetical protein